MKMGCISHNSVGKQKFSKEKIFERQLSVALINSIFLLFIINMKILRNWKMKQDLPYLPYKCADTAYLIPYLAFCF